MRALFLVLWWPVFLWAQNQFYEYDTVLTVPAIPTVKDSVELRLFNYNGCCCSRYYNHAVQTQTGRIYLSYEIDTSPCLLCDCLMAGSWTTFTSGPMPAGYYDVYKAESPYCPPGNACPAIKISPVLVGAMTVVENDTFTIERTGFSCLVLPCMDYRVLSTTKKETVLVAGVKNPNGRYQNPFTKEYVPWRDAGFPVLGYFSTDSLAGWMYREKVFVIAMVLDTSRAVGIGTTHGAAVVSNPTKRSMMSQAGRELSFAEPMTFFKLYSLSGQELFKADCPNGLSKIRIAEDLKAGIYIVRYGSGREVCTGKIQLMP